MYTSALQIIVSLFSSNLLACANKSEYNGILLDWCQIGIILDFIALLNCMLLSLLHCALLDDNTFYNKCWLLYSFYTITWADYTQGLDTLWCKHCKYYSGTCSVNYWCKSISAPNDRLSAICLTLKHVVTMFILSIKNVIDQVCKLQVTQYKYKKDAICRFI